MGGCIANYQTTMLKIQRLENDEVVIFALSGRIEHEHVLKLQTLLDAESRQQALALDLEEVRLVDRDAVRFLAGCEASGVKLKGGPPDIREWIETGSSMRL